MTVSFVEITQGAHNQSVQPSGNYLYNSNSDLIRSFQPATRRAPARRTCSASTSASRESRGTCQSAQEARVALAGRRTPCVAGTTYVCQLGG